MKIYSLISKGVHLLFVIECAHPNSLLNRQCNSVYDVNYVAMFSPQHEQLWAYTSFLWPGMANWSRMNIFFELPLTLCILYLYLEVAVLLAFWTWIFFPAFAAIATALFLRELWARRQKISSWKVYLMFVFWLNLIN